MFEWPRFAAHLCSDRSPKDRLESLLCALGEPLSSEPDVGEVPPTDTLTCIRVTPVRTTTYALAAYGRDGQPVSQQLVIVVR